MSNNIPDYLEPLIGWRLWAGYNTQGFLKALVSDHYWVPSKPAESLCTHCKHPDLPKMNNNSGFYSFKNVAELVKQTQDGRWIYNTQIVGQVYLWGRIVVCEFGYRSQFAYPKALLVSTEQEKDDLEKVWHIPIEVGNIRQLFNQAMTERNT
jgi:hypothetical protein